MRKIYDVDKNITVSASEKQYDKKLIVIFSLLAVFIPLIYRGFNPQISEFFEGLFSLSSFQMPGFRSIISCVGNILALVIIVIGGFVITKSRAGIIRFAGIFILTSTLLNIISSFFTVIINVIFSADATAEAFTEDILLLDVLFGILTVFLNVYLFTAFENRATNRYILPSEEKIIRKKMIKAIIAAIIISEGGKLLLTVCTVFVVGIFEDKKIVAVTTSLLTVIMSIAIAAVFCSFGYGFRKDRIDIIGFAAPYYLPELITIPFYQFIAGAMDMFVRMPETILPGIISIFSSLASIIFTVIGAMMALAFLKYFFSVKEKKKRK